MTTSTVWKLDDQAVFPTNCFPARGIARKLHEGAGSWVVAYAEEQQNKLLAELKPKSNLIQSLIGNEEISPQAEEVPHKTLNAQYLMQRHHIDNAIDLCSINVSDRQLNLAQGNDFRKFINVAYVNAAENSLPLRPFSNFVNLRELELPVNGIQDIELDWNDFPNLQVLDLSYNHLKAKDVLALGVLPNLKVLTLTGNGLTSIHPDMARPEVIPLGGNENDVLPRFSKLEVLYLDDNRLSDLSTFASLAALPQLRELNLDKNGIEVIPHLKVVGDKVVSETQSSMGHHISVASSGKKSRQSQRAASEAAAEARQTELKVEEPKVPELSALKIEEPNENRSSPEYSEGAATPNPPFQHLRLLSVTHNRIKEEECVLAVAAWPRLKHIVLHHNPIVNNNKGDPPLLAYYLKERLGINIHRFEKKTSIMKPHLTIPVEKDRRVTSRIPKIPKQPIDVLINSLMAPPTPQTIHDPPAADAPEPAMHTADDEATTSAPEETFFLTEVEGHEEPGANQDHEKRKKKNDEKSAKKSSPVEEKFKGFEVLLDAQEDGCPLEDVGIQGNVRMLNEMLTHPNMFRNMETVTLDRVRPSYQAEPSKLADAMLVARERKQRKLTTKQGELTEHLKKIRDRSTIDVEVPLVDALNADKHEDLAEEADQLLEKVEIKYKVAREESLKASERVRAAFEDSKKLMSELAN